MSQTHTGLVKRLFELEVPEIADGTVEIKACAREPGHQTKIAVWSNDQNVDPVAACVGVRSARVQMVVKELGGERIDVVPFSENHADFVARALSPATVKQVYLSADGTAADVIVTDRQLGLALGREGQNARLAARLTGVRVEIRSETQVVEGVHAESFSDDASDQKVDPIRSSPISTDATRKESCQHPTEPDPQGTRPLPATVRAGQPYVFISYSRHDHEYVERLVTHLTQHGIACWIDKSGIDYGTRWKSIVSKAVDSCEACVVIMTPSGEESAWVDREISRAEERERLILPLLLSGPRFFSLGHLHYEDVTDQALPSESWIEQLRRYLLVDSAPDKPV